MEKYWTARLVFFAILIGWSTAVFAQETQIQYLSGHDKDDAVPWQFYCTSGAQSGHWTRLTVPSNWELHGFGTLHYHRDLKSAYHELGLYRHNFTVPRDWSGKRVFLVFGGVMTDTRAKLNGHSVGPVHQGGFYQFKYEVTQWLRYGATNTLKVEVAKHSHNASVNGAERTGDFWMFGGIYRPVWLEAEPPQFIERVAVNAQADGKFAMDVFLNDVTNASEVEAQIETLDGKKVGSAIHVQLPSASPPQHWHWWWTQPKPFKREVTLETRIDSPKLWTAETPNLYQVVVRLKQAGKVIHRLQQRFGFRTFEIRDGDGLYVNGKRVVLKGCNRHSFWPDSGRCLSDAVQRLDIATLKDMNMNAVRMSHYPPDADFLDRCDELGIYVLDELAGWHKCYDTKTGKKLVGEMVKRDVNHPCILFWDNGNEGGFNTNLDNVFGKYDPQHRPVLHPWAPFSDMNTAHYLPWDFAKLACQGIPITFHKNHYLADTNSAQKYIYMPTEFMHGLYDGGAGAGLAETWSLMENSPYLGGGFIWAFLDEGVKNPKTGKIDVAGNQAPDGIVGPYRQREASFYTIKEVWSPLVIVETNLPANFAGRLTLQNRYSFINARQCHFHWQLRSFAGVITGRPPAILAEGTAESPEIPPGGHGSLMLNLPANWRQLVKDAGSCALSLRMTDPEKYGLWTYVWPLPSAADSAIPATENDETNLAPAPNILKSHIATEVRAGGLDVTFDAFTGFLAGIKCDGQTFSLTDGPRPVVGDARLIQLTAAVSNREAVVTATYSGNLKRVVWRMLGNKRLECDYTYEARGKHSCFGVLFNYPESNVLSKRWLGDGPYRVWQNRLTGVTFGLWQNEYNNTITGWRDWIYPEFKGCFANVRWLQLDTTEGRITVQPEHVPFVQVLTPEFPPTKLGGHTIPSVPKCGLGFLDAIPAIGSKFQLAKVVSPSGSPAEGKGDYHGLIVFQFGKRP